jgi:hypothetical protein
MSRACSTNGEKRNVYRILVGKPEGKISLRNQNIGGWIILKWILVVLIGSLWLRIGTGGGLL